MISLNHALKLAAGGLAVTFTSGVRPAQAADRAGAQAGDEAGDEAGDAARDGEEVQAIQRQAPAKPGAEQGTVPALLPPIQNSAPPASGDPTAAPTPPAPPQPTTTAPAPAGTISAGIDMYGTLKIV